MKKKKAVTKKMLNSFSKKMSDASKPHKKDLTLTELEKATRGDAFETGNSKTTAKIKKVLDNSKESRFIVISKDQASGILQLLEKVHAWRDENIQQLTFQAHFAAQNDPSKELPVVARINLELESAFTYATILRVGPSLIDNVTKPPNNGCSNCISYFDQASGDTFIVCPTCKASALVK